VLHFGLLMLGALLLNTLPLPWRVAALAAVVAAIVAGVRALIAVRRARASGALVPMLVVGLVIAVMLSLTMMSTFATWPLQMAQQECQRGALTISAQAKCDADFRQGVLDWEQRLRDRTTGGS